MNRWILRAILLALLAPSARAQVGGVSYTFSPSVEYSRFEKNAGLKDNYAFGGTMGLGLGRYVELKVLGLIGRYDTRLGRLGGADSTLAPRLRQLPTRSVRTERWGLALQVNLLPGPIVPYLTAGTGLLRLRPEDDLRASESVYLMGGGGLMFTVASRYAIFAQVENLAYRYNPGAAFLRGEDLNRANLQPANFRQVLVTNWMGRAGMRLYLGGTTSEVEEGLFSQHPANWRPVIDPFVGQLRFNRALDFPSSQRMGGFYLGLALGPTLNLRGFYWRALDSGRLTGTEPMEAYGADLYLSFADAPVTPYLSLGGGYLNVLSGYRGRGGSTPDDQVFASAGVGVSVLLLEALQLQAGVQGIFMTRDGIDNRTAPAQVYGSTLYTVGFSFRPGRLSFLQPRPRRAAEPSAPLITEGEAPTAEPTASPELEARQRLLALREAALTAEIARAEAAGDSLLAARLRAERERLRTEMLTAVSVPAARTTTRQMITLPAPEQGELYVRYGPGSSPLVAAQQPATPAAAAPTPTTTPTSPELQALEQRLLARLEAIERDRQELVRLESRLARLEALLQQIGRGETTVRIQAADTTVTVRPEATPSEESFLQGFRGVAVFGGVNALGAPRQLLIGVRGDYGTWLGGRLHLWPEAVLSFAGGTSGYNLNLNATTPLPALPAPPLLGRLDLEAEPYVGFGLGLLAFSNPPRGVSGIQTVWNLILGAERTYGPGVLFVEYVSMNFFSFNRLQIGYRLAF
ncbi:hypothetical protein [Rhodothermus marinus]|uniref:hypothetical protein n=1 Tax=Rhodothermus marinus TaxID=29549 RepID=UPI001374F956|nr:hypothetical protein [Rhodothermus marinus]